MSDEVQSAQEAVEAGGKGETASICSDFLTKRRGGASQEASTVSPVSPPPPRISAMEAESDSSEAELASVPGRPVAVLRSEARGEPWRVAPL